MFWIWLQRHWSSWRRALVIVKPETVLRGVDARLRLASIPEKSGATGDDAALTRNSRIVYCRLDGT